MKISRKTILIVMTLVAGSYVFGQNGYRNNRSDRQSRFSRPDRSEGGSGGTNQVPGTDDYQAFSGFISQRNIFDPNRQPHFAGSGRVSTPTIRHGAPFFMLVGTMSYQKGSFAFFDGNSSDSRQALQVSGKIQDYTVTAITTKGVSLEAPDKKTLELQIGDRMQEENGKWSFLNGNAMNDSGTPASDEGASSSGESASSTNPSSPPPSADESNDILKRLMQLREKENQ